MKEMAEDVTGLDSGEEPSSQEKLIITDVDSPGKVGKRVVWQLLCIFIVYFYTVLFYAGYD